MAHLDFLDESIKRVSAEIAERLRPFEPALERLDTIPGVGRRIAEIMLAEVGPDLSRFPSAAHLASWAGMCPGNHESAGKRQSGRTRKGNAWLRGALAEAGQAAGRTKHTYLGAQYRRLAARRGRKKATIAVGHTILIIAYHLLTEHRTYHDLGVDYLEKRNRQAVERRLIRHLEALGNKVTLEPIDPAA
jgi:transposase